MKRNLIIILILINTILNVFFIYNHFHYENEDVNKDGIVNSKDLFLVRKYILEN